ncbi:MAG: 5'-3' exonuclease H3TH domain-containing protein [Candidatus Limnocylindria bacterium]
MPRSYTLGGQRTRFDDPRLIADAGLLLPATLAQRLGLRELLASHVDLGAAAGRYARLAVKLHLVDATFELFRAFYSRPAERGPDGRPVNAVRGLVDSMLSLLREPDVTHLAAATDHVIESWRNDVFPGYKSSAGVDRDLLAQFDDAERALRALGMVTWPMIEDEADDALAAAVARFGTDPRVEQVIVCSVDKDLAQCVDGGRVVLRDRMRRVTYDEAGVIAKFGVAPASIPDYLALVGDSSDGYPGLPGWGAKSAATVLARWGQLEAIPDSPLEWEVPLRNAVTLAATLRQQRAQAILYRRLAILNIDAAISGRLDDLEWRGVPREPFLALCDELGFETIRERVHRWAA